MTTELKPAFRKAADRPDTFEVAWLLPRKDMRRRVFKRVSDAEYFIQSLRHAYDQELLNVKLNRLNEGQAKRRRRLDEPPSLDEFEMTVDPYHRWKWRFTVRQKGNQ
jgi:hypothetical protein